MPRRNRNEPAVSAAVPTKYLLAELRQHVESMDLPATTWQERAARVRRRAQILVIFEELQRRDRERSLF